MDSFDYHKTGAVWLILTQTSNLVVMLPVSEILSIEDVGDHRLITTKESTWLVTATINDIVKALNLNVR